MSQVINAYAMLLSSEQERINEGVDALEKSYFINSVCLDMMKNNNIRSRNRYVLENLNVGKLYCYAHFPIRTNLH
ncbi:hypothetical protein LOK49_Contig3G00012 [Camellia lanceoleosa]|nr:hypothetical protein LOK49_Contig3G00012 [Camellia lanceoleosa]